MKIKLVLFFFLFSFGLTTFGQVDIIDVHNRKLAKSFLNQKAPELEGLEWVTKKPKTKGKFVLVDFWTTGCVPCKKGIPKLNEWSKLFKKDLVIIGVVLHKTEDLKAFKEVPIEYYSAANPGKNMLKVLELQFVPHVLLIDPEGIVRWQNNPHTLTEEIVKDLINKYKENKKNKK